MESLRRLHILKSITCPSCKLAVIIDHENIEIKSGQNVVTVKHKVCSSTNPKALHLCIHCGSQSSHSKKRLINNICKCVTKVNKTPPPISDPDPPSILTTPHSTEILLAKVIDILSSQNNTGLDTGTIITSIVSSNELPNFRKESLVEALEFGIGNGSITEINGIYSVNKKPKGQSHDDELLQETPDGVVFEASADDDCWNPEDVSDHMESPTPNYVHSVGQVFSDRSEWPENSAKYFQREHNNPGDGNKGLVVNSILDKNRQSGFKLSDEEMYYHLHAASVHRGITREKSKDVCQLSKHIVLHCGQEMKTALEATDHAYTEALQDNLGEVLNVNQMGSLITQINQCVQKAMKTHYAIADEAQKISHPTDPIKIRTKYTRGENSIMNSLPMPVVEIKYGCAHIPAKQIVNHFLALERDVRWYRAGYEDEWKCNNGNYESGSMAEVHAFVMKLMKEDPSIPKDTRVCFGRVWSDGFEAHHIAAKNGFSSLQLFTLSLLDTNHRITKRNTWPCALCFKKANTPELFIHILEEIHALRKPTLRYWGKDKQLVPTIVYLQMVCQDYPERCYCTFMADLGTYTHRWGHTSLYDNKLTPSCKECEWKHIEHLLTHNDNQIGDCDGDGCLDWYNIGRLNVHGKEEEYPISPAEAVKQSQSGQTIDEKELTIPSVELSFELWENSIKALVDWLKTTPPKRKTSIPKIARTYLKLIGLSPPVAKGLGQDIADGTNASESKWYPLILKRYKELCIELKLFKIMPMHLLFLGVEKSLISKTPAVVNRRIQAQNIFWKSLTESIQSSQSTINSISIEWCKSMAFSGKNRHSIGSAGWQSSHYVAFTRLSLFHFSPMDRKGVVIPPEKQEVIKQFKRLRVIWFCLISHLFTDVANIQSSRIDHYVRLFLSSCRRFWQSAEVDLTGDEFNDDGQEGAEGSNKDMAEKSEVPQSTDVDITGDEFNDDDQECVEGSDERLKDHDTTRPSKRAKTSKPKSTNSKKAKKGQPNSKKAKTSEAKGSEDTTEKSKVPFFVSGSNYLSTLNIMTIIDDIDSIRGLYEGIHESYIQELKRELSTMRHTVEFLATVLGKVLCTSVFSSVNQGNPYSNTDSNARTYNLRIYTIENSEEEILQQNHIVVGMIDKSGDLHVCVDHGPDGIALHPVTFDDSRGDWCFNLWYAGMIIGSSVRMVTNREELMGMCEDFFMFLHHTGEKNRDVGTIICRSWRVRVEGGRIQLPEPQTETLATR